MDLRFTIGLFFAILSAILLATAAIGDASGSSVNGWCGGVMAIFGAVMLWLSKRHA
ncbi:MAG: hypothetical protein ABI823_00665 [Bryobacteraceae bacterium]